MNFKSPQKQCGIALLAVLAVSVALSLLITSATVMMQRQLSIGETAKQQFLEKAAAHKKQQELTYLLATQRLTRAGISKGENQVGLARAYGNFTSLFTNDEIRIDNFEYKQYIDNVDVTYSIQAADGLIPINTPDHYWLKRWLKSYGIDEFTITKLADHLADYADEDDWARPAGAERFSYDADNMLPTNFLLQSCSELHNVKLWASTIEKNRINIHECSLARSPTLGINSLSKDISERLFGDKGKELYYSRKGKEWIVNERQAQQQLPLLNNVQEDYVSSISQRNFIIKTSTANVKQLHYVKIGIQANLPYSLKVRNIN